MRSLGGEKVLVTGSTGFVGANLARMALRSGAEVHVIIRKAADKWRIKEISSDLNEHHGDLSNYECIERIIEDARPEVIYHAAADGGNPAQRDFMEIIRSNFIGTANLVNACKRYGFDLFVNTGSSSEYGVKAVPMREDGLLEPVNDYGVSKSAATLYCQALAREERLPIVTLRLFSPYGSYESATRLIPSAILSCLRGDAPKISSPSFVRDFIYIEDVLDAYIKLYDAPGVCGNIFNIARGEQLSVGDVVQKIIEVTGVDASPVPGVRQAWPNEPKMWQADVSKAKSTIGWEPSYDLEQGIRASVKWFQENLELYQNQGSIP